MEISPASQSDWGQKKEMQSQLVFEFVLIAHAPVGGRWMGPRKGNKEDREVGNSAEAKNDFGSYVIVDSPF